MKIEDSLNFNTITWKNFWYLEAMLIRTEVDKNSLFKYVHGKPLCFSSSCVFFVKSFSSSCCFPGIHLQADIFILNVASEVSICLAIFLLLLLRPIVAHLASSLNSTTLDYYFVQHNYPLYIFHLGLFTHPFAYVNRVLYVSVTHAHIYLDKFTRV